MLWHGNARFHDLCLTLRRYSTRVVKGGGEFIRRRRACFDVNERQARYAPEVGSFHTVNRFEILLKRLAILFARRSAEHQRDPLLRCFRRRVQKTTQQIDRGPCYNAD
jgi:hypothetical protein